MKLTGHNSDTNDGMVPLSEDQKENKKAAEGTSEALASVLPPPLTYIHSMPVHTRILMYLHTYTLTDFHAFLLHPRTHTSTHVHPVTTLDSIPMLPHKHTCTLIHMDKY